MKAIKIIHRYEAIEGKKEHACTNVSYRGKNSQGQKREILFVMCSLNIQRLSLYG